MSVEAVPSEYEAATNSCAVHDASSRELLRVTGPDAVSFLQGMVTNDVAGLTVGDSCYAALLTVKGSMVGDLRVLRRADDVIIDTGAGRGATVKDFLNKYLISEEAEINDAPELAVVSFIGPKSVEVATRVQPREGELVSFFGGVDVVIQRSEVASVLASLNDVTKVSDATVEVLRVENAVPLFGIDMTEVTIPLEANLDHAIHYKKGCYIGQEVIARATYRGQMNKKLVKLELGDQSPPYKTELKVGDRKVGWVTSVVKSPKHGQYLALGYAHRDFLTAGTKFEMAGGSATVA